jgi:hypothetical protein
VGVGCEFGWERGGEFGPQSGCSSKMGGVPEWEMSTKGELNEDFVGFG